MTVIDPKLKKEAIRLRKRGLSYNEIKKEISVAKSTLSLWLKSILLKPQHKKRLYTKQVQILARGPKCQKERRIREIENIVTEARKEILFPLSPDSFRLMGAALYWAEGGKTGMCTMTNSDPNLIAFMTKWIELNFGIPPTDLKVNLNIYPQQNEKKLKEFWSDITEIPLINFGKSFVKPLNKHYKKNNLYYGTIRIYIPKSVNIKHRIFGWINVALSNITPKVELVQKKWYSLTKVQRNTPVNLK